MVIRRNTEITLFFVGVILFSWAFWVPAAWLMNEQSIGELMTSPIFIALQTLGAAGPSIVAYLFLRKLHGKEAIQKIIDRYKIWGVEKKWVFLSIFLIPLISLSALFIQDQFFTPAFSEGQALYNMIEEMGWAALLILPITFVAQIFTSPLLEEFGWRGYAQPILQKNFSILTASTIIGFVWGFWHLPLIIAYGNSLSISIVSTICHSIIIGWLLNSTRGSMFLVMLFHASLNIGLNILSPGHDNLILLSLTILVTVFVGYKINRDDLLPFNK